jgi:hypothetical protein
MGNKPSTLSKPAPSSFKTATLTNSSGKASVIPTQKDPKPESTLGVRDHEYISALSLAKELPFHLANTGVQDTAGSNTVSIRSEAFHKLREDDKFVYMLRQGREGTGTVIGTYGANWLILTARHSIWKSCNPDKQLVLNSAQNVAPYTRLYYSTKYDLALVFAPFEMKQHSGPPPLARISRRKSLVMDELLQGCGFPAGFRTDMLGQYKCRATTNPALHSTSARKRSLNVNRPRDFLDMASGPGSSGSAIYDTNSEVVGLLTGGVLSSESTPTEYTVMETARTIEEFLQDAIWKSLCEPSKEGWTITGLKGDGWDYSKPGVSPESVSAEWKFYNSWRCYSVC